MWELNLFPEQASTFAPKVDSLYFALIAISAFFTLAIYFAIGFFAVRYRRGSRADRSNPPASSHKLEATWIIIPLGIVMVIFVWATSVYFTMVRPPANAVEIQATGKQWMWKFQSPTGQREINELHIPVGRPVKINMISEDVIHSLFFPSFRIKQDVLPGRYTQLWFEPTKTGIYHIFCAEYCGTQHSGMIGRVIVMSPVDYQAWLSGVNSSESATAAGERLFNQYACASCHTPGGGGRGPSLVGLLGKQVKLASGETIVANEQYIRESIMEPKKHLVAGYEAIMPTFAGQINEDGIIQIIAYLKSQGGTTAPTMGTPEGGANAPLPGNAQTPAAGQMAPSTARPQEESGSSRSNDQNTTQR